MSEKFDNTNAEIRTPQSMIMGVTAMAEPAISKLLKKMAANMVGLNKGDRVVVAMSGGVDSSVVAGFLKHQGYDVVGVTMQLYNQPTSTNAVRTKACCAGADILDAKKTAGRLEIPHYVLDYESQFSEAVIKNFVESYLSGETPIPCVRCNQSVKFSDLYRMAKNLGAAALVTGHYAGRVQNPITGKWHISKALDQTKDQSYFLFATNEIQLEFLRFPLANLTKIETRQLARHFGLAIAEKPDSQDICFVPNGDYRKVLAQHAPNAFQQGDVVLQNGAVIGQHTGIAGYTIGQRRGIKIGGRPHVEKSIAKNIKATHIKPVGVKDTEPLFVLKLDPVKNQLVVGEKAELKTTIIWLKECYWSNYFLAMDDLDNRAYGAKLGKNHKLARFIDNNLWLKFRSQMSKVAGVVKKLSDTTAQVTFAEPQYGVAPGQALVVYAKLSMPAKAKTEWLVLGGGFITADAP